MFDNRHCIEADYSLLNKETDKIIKTILTNPKTLKNDIDGYLRLIARFDIDISEILTRKLLKENITPSQMVDILNQYIDILKQQVLVDIREHN